MKEKPASEEEINARLRELTRDTLLIREELVGMLGNRYRDSLRSVADDRAIGQVPSVVVGERGSQSKSRRQAPRKKR